MWNAQISNIPSAILLQYGPSLTELQWVAVPGGLSSADVWRGDDARGQPQIALKRWPRGTAASRMAQIHAWMREAAHLSFVPSVFATVAGQTIAAMGDELWDAVRWRPGTPSIPASAMEIENACEAIAELHGAWSHSLELAPCPGIRRRIEVLSEWLAKPLRYSQVHQELIPLYERAHEAIQRTAPLALAALEPWRNVRLAIQPCLRDLRAEHVLFEHSRVAGIVDYGAMAVDSPAIDLARLLGDMTGDNAELFARGINRYRACRASFAASELLVQQLDGAGVVCSLIGWFARPAREISRLPVEKIATRLLHLILRAEEIKSY